MTLRNRLTLAAAVAVAVAVVASSAVIYVIVRGELRGDVDESLRERATEIAHEQAVRVNGVARELLLPSLDSSGTYAHIIFANRVVGPPGIQVPFQPSERAQAVALGNQPAYFEDVTVRGTPVRVLTAPVATNVAVQVARSLGEVNGTLKRLGLILAGVAAVGIGIAVLLGRGVARAALAPVRKLTDATEHVTTTGDLSSRIETSGSDEVSRLASSFNSMLGALERSVDQQRQLVADASHELRTPLTSLRTNIEILALSADMNKDDRANLLKDVVDQLEELTSLVGDLVELARGHEPVMTVDDVQVNDLVLASVDKARRRWPAVRFDTRVTECVIRGTPERLERAIGNLLDNGAKWSPQGGVVDVAVDGSGITVRDHGPGIDEADLPHIFDRFYRSTSARGTPGSGLGLAIVRQVIESHGGRITVENAEGGGARFRLEFPTARREENGSVEAAAQSS
jgi:two-component system, OmpR family, sensor histidine kinase MprB